MLQTKSLVLTRLWPSSRSDLIDNVFLLHCIRSFCSLVPLGAGKFTFLAELLSFNQY